MQHRWAYGVTTCAARIQNLLPRTLASLATGGFDNPRLFVDGCSRIPEEFDGYERTFRYPTIRTYGNWVLGLAELYLRQPDAERFAMFQDDFVTYKNLLQYLDGCKMRKETYWNLYTFPKNQNLCPKDKEGWFESDQCGKGAVALVFDRDTVLTLLTHQHMVHRPMDAHRGWRTIDGGIVTALKKAGYKELVHNPSLVQHTGKKSSMGNVEHPLSPSFRGENFDATRLKCS